MLRRPPNSLMLLALVAIGCGDSVRNGAATKSTSPPPQVVRPANATPPPPTTNDGLIADDGRTLWASPTAGDPIDLSLVPSKSGLFVYFQPRALLATAEGRRVWRALEPAIGDAASESPESIDVLTMGVAAGEDYESVRTTVAVDPQPSDELPLLSREFEQLLETTDRDRLLTLVASPPFLVGDGCALLSGPWAPLRELVLAQARDEWAAVALSLHLDQSGRLYWELRVLADAAEPEVRTAAGIVQRSRAWGDELEAVVEDHEWSPYSRALIDRSPGMLAVVGKYARRGVDGRQAVVNGYAPPGAAHQLALAAERLVAELAAPIGGEPAVAAAPKRPELSMAQRLQAPVTIRFERESLVTAVAILSETFGAPIEIESRDLQLEGITRNQMLGLDVTDVPAADALVEVLRRANPDKEATGPADVRQKLVYVVDTDGVTITTRAAAESRGDQLPTVFQPN